MIYKKLFTLIILIVLFVMLFYLKVKIDYQNRKNPIILSSPKYCEEISYQILDLELKQFYFEDIEVNDDKLIFCFLIDEEIYYNSYDYDESILDILNVRRTVTEYLNNNPESKLNEKYIEFTFNLLCGEEFYMYNYSKDEKSVPENQFLYFENIYIDSKFFSDFTDAHVIGIHLNSIDDILLLNNYTNLEYVHLSATNLNICTICKFKSTFPDCKIYYYDEII